MVMPHSALQTGQYTKWRSGAWQASNRLRTLSVDFGFKPAWDLERLQPNTFFPVPSSVVFAKNKGLVGEASPLKGDVQRWIGQTGDANLSRVDTGITDTSVGGESPYAKHARQGAAIVPRCLFFVTETENTAVVQAGQTFTVNPRRGSQDKKPWRDLDLTAITGQTIESRHVYDVHLGETVVPYCTLQPLHAILPLKQGDAAIPRNPKGPGGIRLAGLDQRMRTRWQSVSQFWDNNKALANQLDLLGRIDYHGELSSQLRWQSNPTDRLVRLIYTSAGQPTAAIVRDNNAVIDYKLFWMTCGDLNEANYLLAIINSESLAGAVNPLTTPNWAGKIRDLQKHLWKLPIPEFDAANPLHVAISEAGETAAAGAAQQLAQLREQRDNVTVTIARREIRKWLRESEEGKTVEMVVAKLLAGA